MLHQLGSHGPAYFRRYPPAFAHFTPACENDDLQKCTREEIVNAYDNSLRYTDHVLGSLIATLQRNEAEVDSALIYVSDHGESLGERNLYLHGLPWFIAPKEQKQVPMVMWLSSGIARASASRHRVPASARGRAGIARPPVPHGARPARREDRCLRARVGSRRRLQEDTVTTAAAPNGRDLRVTGLLLAALLAWDFAAPICRFPASSPTRTASPRATMLVPTLLHIGGRWLAWAIALVLVVGMRKPAVRRRLTARSASPGWP